MPFVTVDVKIFIHINIFVFLPQLLNFIDFVPTLFLKLCYNDSDVVLFATYSFFTCLPSTNCERRFVSLIFTQLVSFSYLAVCSLTETFYLASLLVEITVQAFAEIFSVYVVREAVSIHQNDIVWFDYMSALVRRLGCIMRH